MDIIARENDPHGNGDMAVLRDDELDAVTGGGKILAGKAKIVDGRMELSPGLVIRPAI
jgi:hypothetical protein